MSDFLLNWQTVNIDGANTLSGSGDTLDVTISTPSNGDGDNWSIGNVGGDTTLKSADVDDPTKVQMDFSEAVENVTFEIYDVDSGSGWDDHITITAIGPDGVEVAVQFSDLHLHSVNDNTIEGAGNDSPGVEGSGAPDSVTVTIPGPIQSLTVIHDDGDSANESGTVGFSDMSFDMAALGGPVDGTSGDDVMLPGYVDMDNDTIDGADGDDDVVYGYDGDDVIDGGAGTNTLFGGAGDDDFIGGEGADIFYGGMGQDNLDYSSSDAAVTVDLSTNSLSGGDADNDTIGAGIDGVVGSDYDDTLIGFDHEGTAEPDVFTNEFYGGGGEDFIKGNGGNDLLDGGDDNDEVYGGGGADIIDGGAGADVIEAGDGTDKVSAGDGNDTVFGGDGNDTLSGNDGDDTIYGEEGDDRLFGGEGADSLYGGEGDDTLSGNRDGDLLDGGAGDDTLNGDIAADTLFGGDGDDLIRGENGDDIIFGGDGSDTADGGDGNDTIDTSGPVDVANDIGTPDIGYPGLYDADADPTNDMDTVFGGGGSDTITTGDDADSIDGGSGNDVIDAGIDNDVIDGGAGDDTIVAGEGQDIVDGGAGNDLIYGGLEGIDVLDIPDAIDLAPSNGLDTLSGGDGDDTIYGADDDDLIFGGNDNDVIYGGIDDDTMYGDAGEDYFEGGEGSDIAYGGDDADKFVITSVEDADGDVVDGGTGGDDNDVLDLSGLGPFQIVGETVDADGDSTSGTIQFLDAPDGTVIGSMEFAEIETIVPCFTPGTMIATMEGEKLVENLTVGDRVITRDNGAQEIRWLGSKPMNGMQLQANPQLQPILVRKGALGAGLPERDMLVSPNHRVLVSNAEVGVLFNEPEVLIAAKHMVDADKGIVKVAASSATYIHFMFDHHEVVLSNGAWTESFQPGDQAMAGVSGEQRDEITELFPELANTEGREAYTSSRLSLKGYEAKMLK